MIVDLFAGGGGASVGIEAALDRPVDVAVNHDPVAIAVHRANHPRTLHLEANVWEVKPREATHGEPVELLWASPDCTHFSRAKGGKPRSQGIRSLAWVVIEWAREVRPRVICLENVREFQTWGPLLKDGHVCPDRAGQHYDEWVEALRRLGYQVESRILDASLYGAPTRRLRLFVVARCDGEPIVWPEPTHGSGLLPLRTAAECIDWSLPCPSIFDRKRPLAPATLRRVAEGIRRFVLESGDPFIVLCNHGRDQWRGQDIHDPMRTVTAAHDARGLVLPVLTKFQENSVGQDPREPLHTVMAGAPRFGLVAPSLVHTGNGERPGQTPRAKPCDAPAGTITATGSQGAIVAAFLARHFGGMVGRDLCEPMPTITAVDHHGPITAHLTKFYGTSTGSSLQEPAPTATAGAGGGHHGLVAAMLAKYYGKSEGQAASDPLHTITSRARFALVAAFLQRHGIECGEVATVKVQGEMYAVADIGLRMLEPHELLRAQFGSFADRYDLSAARTKKDKIRLIGNSVCPNVAEALVRANFAMEVSALEGSDGVR